MTESVPRAAVEAFYRAYISRDPQRIGAALDDDVEWHVNGPAEVIKICGSWRGKTAVVERFSGLVPQVIAFKALEIEHLLVDGDCSAMFGRLTCHHRETGRVISHRVSHIARYRNGKVAYFRVVNDTFDAAEQFLGHRLNVEDAPGADEGNLIAI
ncbi:MAG TPA: nuclear transport factor 2 family protein [Pseudolabrys sp.]|jgi:ketosteroid isomerase-like protein|nr:nuclear transport factor 2 family protein [Pseudolabrys sp.]